MPRVQLLPIRPLTILAGLLLAFSVCAEDETGDGLHGTAEEAQALVARAISYYDEAGLETAFAAFNDREGEFVKHDLYIFVYGPDRTIVSHGADVGLIGTPTDTLIDINGKPFGTAIQDEATEEGVWVDYTWYNPVDRELHPKSSWLIRHDGNVFGAGIYLPEGVDSGEAAKLLDEEHPGEEESPVAAGADEAAPASDAGETPGELMEETMPGSAEEAVENMMDEAAEHIPDEAAVEETMEAAEAAIEEATEDA